MPHGLNNWSRHVFRRSSTLSLHFVFPSSRLKATRAANVTAWAEICSRFATLREKHLPSVPPQFAACHPTLVRRQPRPLPRQPASRPARPNKSKIRRRTSSNGGRSASRSPASLAPAIPDTVYTNLPYGNRRWGRESGLHLLRQQSCPAEAAIRRLTGAAAEKGRISGR